MDDSDSESEVTFRKDDGFSSVENNTVGHSVSSESQNHDSQSENIQSIEQISSDIMRELGKQLDSFSQEIYRNLDEIRSEMRQQISEIRTDVNGLVKRVDHLEKKLEGDNGLGQSFSRGDNYNNSRVQDRNENHQEPDHTLFRPMTSKSNTRLKPQTYNGSEDFEEYLSQYEIIAQINNWDYKEKSLYLAGSLSGSARTVLTELSTQDRQDYDSLVDILNMRYGSVERSEMYRARLQTKVRGKEESLSELAQSIRKLTRQAYPTADSSLINILALDHYIDSIQDSELRLRLRELRPKNINEAETHAVRLEAHRLADRQRGKAVKSVQITDKSPAEASMCQENRHPVTNDGEVLDIGSLTRCMFNLDRSTKLLVKALNNQGNKPANQPQRQPSVWNNNSNRQHGPTNNGPSRGDNRNRQNHSFRQGAHPFPNGNQRGDNFQNCQPNYRHQNQASGNR
ncbi:uncharacterized protein DDB_G0283697-like [Argopecten irradians]|uniref:uncharacterized protein DDB_G0283697-like n=1 Tax=Argopecten irradians TaxID=31199 RepID=UPI00371B64B2